MLKFNFDNEGNFNSIDGTENNYFYIDFNGKPIKIVFNRIKFSRYSGTTTTRAISQNGSSFGYMESYTIDNRGIIWGLKSNGGKYPIAKISTAVFKDNAALFREDDISFSNEDVTNFVKYDDDLKIGKIISGTLEMSNVDLSEENDEMKILQTIYDETDKMTN